MSDENKEHADRVTLLLGFASAILFDLDSKMTPKQKKLVSWFKQAVASVVYGNGKVPPLPDEGLH